MKAQKADQNVRMTEPQILYKVLKTDTNTGQPLAGVTLQLQNENGAILDEWITDGDYHYIDSSLLEAGKTYKIHEVAVPYGYYLRESDVSFTVSAYRPDDSVLDNGYVTVTVDNTRLDYEVTKVDSETGEYVVGARLKLIDENGNEMIYARGKNGVITNKEVEQAIAFYDTFGMSAEEARKQAILYVEEREALYQQAIEAGYTVTDKEVYDYLEELKQFINQSENKEDAMAIIEQFDSEEDYWNYEFEVYKKDLPIQKYMAAKEKEFKEVAPQAKSINEIEEEWQEYYEQIKAQAVENEEFKVVD